MSGSAEVLVDRGVEEPVVFRVADSVRSLSLSNVVVITIIAVQMVYSPALTLYRVLVLDGAKSPADGICRFSVSDNTVLAELPG